MHIPSQSSHHLIIDIGVKNKKQQPHQPSSLEVVYLLREGIELVRGTELHSLPQVSGAWI